MDVSSRPWKFRGEEYEGAPLLLRYPLDIDFSVARPGFPRLLVVTHKLAQVQASGLPVRSYNDSLEEFDVHMVRLFGEEGSGICVLVETFSGKRTYYTYVSNEANVGEAERKTKGLFPEHDLTWELEGDASWRVIRRYAHDFKLGT